jgi:hypothetical protein
VSLRRPLRATLGIPSGKKRNKRNRAGWYAALILGAGALTGIAALLGVWPFGDLRVFVSDAMRPHASSSQIQARAIFPPVGPQHRVLDVYDAPPQVAAAGGQPNPGGGNFPVINFPAGPMSAIEATCEAAKQSAENKSEAYKQSVELQCEAAKQAYEQSHP